MIEAEAASATDGMSIGAGLTMPDSGKWHCVWSVTKYASEADYEAGDAYESNVIPGNLLTTAGLGRIATLINAGTGNLISSTTARVGVGNGGGTAAVGDTDLSASAGSANRWFQTCTVTVPSNVWTFVAVFGSADGNFNWTEFGIDIGNATVSSGNTVGLVLLNHKTSIAQGTKASGQVWTATATITIS